MWDQKINKIIACIAVASLVLLFVALPVRASDWLNYQTPAQWQTTSEQAPMQMHKMSGRYGTLQSAKDFMHAEIKNEQGEPLGTVREILLDNNQNVVCYVVIESANGILHPVPWSAFTVSPHRITLNIDRAKFTLSPSIRIEDLGKLYAPDYRESINDYFSQVIYNAQEKNTSAVSEEMMETPGTAETLDLYRCSGAIGLDVRTLGGKNIATLKNLVFDTREGNLAYGLVAFGGFLGIGEKTAAVPWASLAVQPDTAIVKLDATRDELNESVLPGDNLRKLTEQQFARQIHENFGVQPYWEVLGFVAPK
jgi:sporulation protein YlmC with PRC-barrel domain